MSPIDFAIRRPVTVLVGVMLTVLAGVLAFFRLPIQLTPNVDRPIVTVQTFWEGASPQEVEREVIERQEEKLKSIQGLRKMTSTASEGVANIELEFYLGTDISRAMLDTSEKLRQVPAYPENVDQPVVASGETQVANAIAWFILRKTPGSPVRDEEIATFATLLEEKVKPRLERAAGIAIVQVVGGQEREVHVRVDPFKLAARGLTLVDVRDAIRARNLDVSAGSIDQGKHALAVRTIGRFRTLAEIEDLVLAQRDGRPVYLRDVGGASMGYKRATRIVRSLGVPAIALNASRQSGTNVIQVMHALQDKVAEVNRDLLASEGLQLTQVYDQTEYIDQAIALVTGNLWLAILLTVIVLLLFLREWRSTLVLGFSIPVSTIGAFVGLAAMGRNLNVVSLAGLAFAVGMVVDNSIVVLENVYRHRQAGLSGFEAARRGAGEVWGAVLASTATTLAVFIPVIYIEEEAGQLFRDIAIAISFAVGMSLVVSVLLIPMLGARLGEARAPRGWRAHLFGLVRFGTAFQSAVCSAVAWIIGRRWRAALTVVVFTTLSLLGSLWLLPDMSYLPAGNQNLVFGFVLSPPGYNADEFTRMGQRIEARLRPYWSQPPGQELPAELQHPAWYRGEAPIPPIENFFFVAFGSSAFMGGRSADPQNVKPLADLFGWAASDVPGTRVFASQRSLFERGVTAGNTIDLEVTGYELGEINAAAGVLIGAITPVLGFPRPEPANFALGGPEVRVVVAEERAAELGLNVRDMGFVVRCMVDGAIVSELREEGVTLDVKILPALTNGQDSEEARPYQTIAELPVATRSGRRVSLGSVSKLVETTSPTEIRHVEERRAVKLIVTPPKGMELGAALAVLQDQIVAPLREKGALPPGVQTQLAGTADKLVATRQAFQGVLLLALAITYLLMAALFESFLHPFVIMFSVPLAGVGGVAALRLLNALTGQQMDVVTLLGFVILTGTVVNNAILIVHQGLIHIREEGMAITPAIVESVRGRIRPIYMTTGTTVLGMLPLVLSPGAGSELYRGLGAVVVGGLAVSSVFTLLVVPALFRLMLRDRPAARPA